MGTILAIIASSAVLLGLMVWARRPEDETHEAFLGLTVAMAAWVISNAIFVNGIDSSWQYIVALLSYTAAGLVATYFLYFTMALTFQKKQPWLVATGIVISVLSALPGLLATGVHGDKIITTQLIGLYAIFIVSYFFTGAIFLFKGRKKAIKRRRNQIQTVLIGAIGSIFGGAIFNLFLPLLGNYAFVALGPASSLIFVYFFSYSIIRHHMFDIRRSFARVIAYGLSVLVLGLGFGAFASYFLSLIPASDRVRPYVITSVVLLIAILYPPAKDIFDRLTRNIFYRQEYDIQHAIDQMTDIFVKSRTTHHLTKESMSTLRTILGVKKAEVVDELDATINAFMKREKIEILSSEDVEEKESNEHIITLLDDTDVALIATLKVEGHVVGHLVCGRKANGTSYSKHDLEFMSILKDEFAIAYENVRRLEKIENFSENLKTEIHDATSQLRASNRKLQKLDESKDEFISMASHQLRTPLTSIKGYISMVLDGDMGEITPQQRKVLEEAFASSQRMVYLIGDFLNVSRIQTGKFMLEKSRVQLATIIKDEIDQLKETASARGIKLAYTAPDNFPELELDENKIRQVMMNFIDNAIYYSPSDTTITISIMKHPHDISFKVEDQGIGVPKSEQHQLFTKFYRASNARKQRPDGTGIGLFMAKKVIVAHGGTIIFETTEGKGSTFGFRLPLAAAKIPAVAAQTEATVPQV